MDGARPRLYRDCTVVCTLARAIIWRLEERTWKSKSARPVWSPSSPGTVVQLWAWPGTSTRPSRPAMAAQLERVHNRMPARPSATLASPLASTLQSLLIPSTPRPAARRQNGSPGLFSSFYLFITKASCACCLFCCRLWLAAVAYLDICTTPALQLV